MKSRSAQLDIFKLILIISVIIIHSNTYLHLRIEKTIPFVYFIQLAVPMFMVMSGYTFALSYSKLENPRDYYKFNRIVPRIIRFLVPIVVTDLAYLAARIISGQTADMIKPAITLNFGPGSYYFMLIIELLLIFPLVYAIVAKWGGYGVVVCIAINIVSELLSACLNMSAYWYARNIFEYFACIGLGCYILHLYFTKKEKKIWLYVCSAIVGLVWITYTQYGVIQNSLFSRNLAYGLPVAFYVWIIVLVVTEIRCERKNKGIRVFAEFGRASFHILCVQMIWFTSLSTIREKLPFILPSVYFMPISIVVCVLFGYAFYKIDAVVQSRVSKLFK